MSRNCDALAMLMAECLDATRKAHNLPQTVLASTAEVAPDTVGDVLDGHTARTSTLDKLATAMGYQWQVRLVPRTQR